MIPDIIHFIWIGNNLPEFARHNIERFRQLNPGFEVMVHDERALSNQYKTYYDMTPELCSKTDILRLAALKTHGGWYFDCDFVPLLPISAIRDRYPAMKEVFLTRQTDSPHWDSNKVIANGIIGISKDSPAWSIIDRLVDSAAMGAPNRTMFGPPIMTHIAKANPELVTVSETRDFYAWPLDRRHEAQAFLRRQVAHDLPWQDVVCTFDSKHQDEGRVPIAYHLWAGGSSEDIIPAELMWSGAPPDTAKLVVVANYNDQGYGNFNRIINNMDVVIRMNRCLGFGNEQFRMGEKVDILSLVSACSSTHGFDKPVDYMCVGSGRVRKQLKQVWYTRPKGWAYAHEKDEGHIITKAQGFPEDLVSYISQDLWDRLDADLRAIDTKYVSPSTGIVTIYRALFDPELAEHTKYIVGFTHKGWAGHPFAAEQQLINKLVEAGKLVRLESAIGREPK